MPSTLFPRPSPASNAGRRWLFGLAALLVILMVVVVLLAAVGSTVQSGVRAYVGAEGLWSKAQKDAVLHLDSYARTGSEADWATYVDELDVILGDTRARVELERPVADMTVVADGFIAGRVAPEDVESMAMVFRSFRHMGNIDQAIAVWTEADGEIDRLRQTADHIRAAVLEGDRVMAASLAADLDAADTRLTSFEDTFSQTLGAGARWLQGVLLAMMAIAVGLLVVITATLGWFMVGRLRASDLAAAERLRASQSRLRLLLDHLPAIIWTTDVSLTITSLTGQGMTKLGIDDSALVGRPLGALFEDVIENRAVFVTHRAAVAGVAGGSYRTTVAERTLQVHVEPITVDGRVIGAISVGLDLTDRLELEARLERSTRLESIGRLAGGVAHDFNNLLTAITGYSELLVSALPDGDERHDAEEIHRAAKRAANLTGQLLAFGRRSVLKPEVVSPNVVIDEMRNMVRRLVGDDIDIEFDLDPVIPAVLADPGQLEQVILNLVVNARDAMPDGGRLTITTRAAQAEDDQWGPGHGRVAISIVDTGIGMDEATRARIFEPFFTTKGQGKGTGLGLSTAYGIVTQSGGSIRAVSELGAGATLTIDLPAAAPIIAVPVLRRTLPSKDDALPTAAIAAEDAARSPVRNGRSTVATGGPIILLAEDDPAVRSLVEHVLRAAGFTVIAAVDGREALDLASDLPTIDLLLTDVMMPRLNGPALAAALREQRPNQRVLFMSGFTDDVLGGRGIIAPGVDLMTKPFSPKDVVARVRRILAITGDPAVQELPVG